MSPCLELGLALGLMLFLCSVGGSLEGLGLVLGRGHVGGFGQILVLEEA